MSKLKTPNDGARAERKAVRRKLRAMLDASPNRARRKALFDVLDFLAERATRTAHRKGGLGRK